ncbi:hypothetical protein BDU57DRAFT_555811 [Ampelomyces quisqualis]|uniref:Secreted protein n=1 Tax=Ampelomyces quisqualis TaxID=50730 RepID=A0A6A5QUC1_AMPQU|nr:hypothetical protein BDU57DRAFT_555811 [Ampelomyces quisqualis]
MTRLFSTLLILASALVAHAGVQQIDFTGVGHIYVLQSDSWQTATPKQKVGCLDDYGKFVNDQTKACGTFSRLNNYPYTLSSKHGNCTFEDKTQPRNTDSIYGGADYAWNCQNNYKTEIYDELYTIDGFPYVFLCFGDFGCYYDAKKTPSGHEILALWQYRWGSQQMGITPGHVQLQLLWKKLGDLPKREDETKIPSPRIEISEGMQVPLEGRRAKDY